MGLVGHTDQYQKFAGQQGGRTRYADSGPLTRPACRRAERPNLHGQYLDRHQGGARPERRLFARSPRASPSLSVTLSSNPTADLSPRLAGLETPSRRVLAASEDNGLAASASSPGLARSMRLLVPLTADRVLAKARLRWPGWSLFCGCPRASCDSHLACAALAAAGRERLKKGMSCW
jgi:hypothetical protein